MLSALFKKYTLFLLPFKKLARGLKILPVMEATRVKFKDTECIAKEELAELEDLSNNTKHNASILMLDSWDIGDTIYRYPKTTVGCEMKGFTEPSLIFLSQVFSEA